MPASMLSTPVRSNNFTYSFELFDGSSLGCAVLEDVHMGAKGVCSDLESSEVVHPSQHVGPASMQARWMTPVIAARYPEARFAALAQVCVRAGGVGHAEVHGRRLRVRLQHAAVPMQPAGHHGAPAAAQAAAAASAWAPVLLRGAQSL